MTSSEMDAIASCPGDETLAAFVDDRIEAGERQAVVAHVADCADCRDMVLIASEARAAGGENVVRAGFRRRRFGPLIAAAAAVLVLLGIPSIRERILPGDPMRDVAEVAETASLRASDARLSVDEAYKPARNTTRGRAGDAELSAEQALAEAKERSERAPTVENLHAFGVASLLSARPREAVSALEAARRAAKAPSAALLNDLSAAYYGTGDYRRAVEAADRSWTIEPTPGAMWNRAVALRALSRDAEAIEAWTRFLSLEKDAAWNDAARQAIKDLHSLP